MKKNCNKNKEDLFLKSLGLKEGDLALDIGYYSDGFFTLSTSKIIGLNSSIYILNFKDNALKIRSNNYQSNMISIFFDETTKSLPFKSNFFDFILVDLKWFYEILSPFKFFLNEIFRVAVYKKKILFFLKKDSKKNNKKIKEDFLNSLNITSSSDLTIGTYLDKKSQYFFIKD